MATLRRELEDTEKKPLLTTPEREDMFAGLSFPEPPTGVLLREVQPQPSTTRTLPFNPVSLHSYETEAISKPVASAVHDDSFPTKTILKRPTGTNVPVRAPVGETKPFSPLVAAPQSKEASSINTAPNTLAESTKNFKALYISEKPPAGLCYPSLPNEEQVINKPKPSGPAYESVSRDPASAATRLNVVGDVELQPWNKYSSKTSQPSAPTMAISASNMLPPTPLVISASHNNYVGDPTVLNEVLDENARLKRELEEMRRTSGQIYYPPMTSAASGPVVTGIGANHRVSGTTPVPVSSEMKTATNPPVQQKYVCCGSCNQWLAAPRDADLVKCPQCEAVNDCALAERRQRAPARRSDGVVMLAI